MGGKRIPPLFLVAASLLLGGAAAYGAGAQITGDGVGAVELGAKASELSQAGLIGPLKPGCELGGPKTRTAKLKAPLKGSVNFTLTTPRRVDNILVTGGATASGVGIGSRKRAIKNEFPHVKVNHTTESVFGITSFRVPRPDGGKFEFAVDVDTKRVTLIGIPFIAFCE
jgi:hypothetical protein